MNHLLNKFPAILICLLLVFMPAGYAQQFSGTSLYMESDDYEQSNESSDRIVSEVVINVSEDGQITILNSDADNVSSNENIIGAQEIFPEADDSCSDANSRNLGTSYYEYIDYNCDIDWHKWYLPSSGRFTAELDVPSGYDYELNVYKSCSSVVCSSTRGTGSDEQCSVDANAGWIYAAFKLLPIKMGLSAL